MSTRTLGFVVTAMVAASVLCGCRHIEPADKNLPPVPTVTTDLGCLTKTYRQDGSCYVTQQIQNVATSASYIRVHGTEPEGSYDWQLNMGFFSVARDVPGEMKWLPAEVSTIEYCRLVLAALQAQPAEQAVGAPVRVLGNWATPVASGDGMTWYRSSPNAKAADIVVLESQDAWQLAVRSYGYRNAAGGQLLPSRIEIYRTGGSAADRLLLEVDYIE